MAWPRYTIKQPVTKRPPNEKSSLPWLQREVQPWLLQAHKVIDWLVTWIAKVQVDNDQTPVVLENALVGAGGLTITKTGTTPNKKLTLTAAAPTPSVYDMPISLPDVLPSNKELVGFVFVRAMRLPTTGHQANASIAALADSTITTKKVTAAGVSSDIGAVDWDADGKLGTVTVPVAIDFAIGDTVLWWNQAIADANLADVHMTYKWEYL